MAKEKIKITFQEVIAWVFSNDPVPEKFMMNKSKLDSIVPYIQEKLWYNIELSAAIADLVNDLYKIPDSIDLLLFYRDLFRKQGIQKHHFWNYFPKYTTDVIQRIQEVENLGENDARARFKMLVLSGNKNPDYVKAKPDLKDTGNINDIKEALKVEQSKKDFVIQKVVNTNLYLSHIDQELIDEMELTLFNVKLLKKRNEILMTFIDKEHRKKYYLSPFEASIYVSKSNSVIENDYLISPTDGEFIEYLISDWELLNRLKFAMNANYKSQINLQGY